MNIAPKTPIMSVTAKPLIVPLVKKNKTKPAKIVVILASKIVEKTLLNPNFTAVKGAFLF